MKTPIVQKFTLAAGASTQPIDMEFNFIHIRPENSATYSDELSMKLDGGSFEKVATGFGFGSEEISQQIQLRNDSVSAITFTLTLFKGNVFSNNQNFDGTMAVGTVVIDDSTPIKIAEQNQIEINDTTPVKVDDDATQILLTDIKNILTTIDGVLDNIKTSNDTIVTNTTP